MIIATGLLVVIDVIGYAFKVKADKEFAENKCRKYPFMWWFYDK
jgi:hypothetical protein